LLEEQRQAQEKLKPKVEDKPKLPPITITIPPKAPSYAPQVRAGPVGPQPMTATNNDTKKEISPIELDKLRKQAGGWKEDFVVQRALQESMATLWL